MNTTDKVIAAGTDSLNSVTQIGRDARADLHGAIDKAADKAHPAIDRMATSAHGGVDKVGDTLSKAGDTLDDVQVTLAERTKQLGQAYKRFAETGRGYVRTSPAVSVLVAVAAGYGLSKLLGSRK
jgi:ElaB/YqjD/DUF883 family membrane-anchored ribosome-binding protein